MIKLSLIKQILNVNDCKIVTSPNLKILGFFEVIKCNSEPPLLCFSSFHVFGGDPGVSEHTEVKGQF